MTPSPAPLKIRKGSAHRARPLSGQWIIFGRPPSLGGVDYPLLGAKSFPAMVSAYLLKLLALLTPEPMRRTLQYLVIDFP
jgi:hypothetical protein